MAKLTRYTQKTFGTSAGLQEMAEFGSLAASAPARYSGATITPAIVQTLTNYGQGWFAAVEAVNSPAIEDMNSLCYLFAYQLTYLMQEGVPEYDTGTTYYIGSLVNNGTGILYVSLTNTNLNQPLTDWTQWFTPTQNGVLTVNALPTTMTLPASKTMTWPNLTIANGQTLTVPNSASLIGVTQITISGTGSLQVTGTGKVRIL